MFQPRFSISVETANALMQIEASRQIVDSWPLTVTLLESLRSSARLLATH